MTLFAGLTQLIGCSFLARLAAAPGAWLTTFFDGAEEIWVQDPFLSDDDDMWLASEPLASLSG